MALVLVIDDEARFRELVREVLQEAGHQVVDAPDGRVGFRMFLDHRPDLVIMDLFMPEQEGIETIRQIRAEAPDIRIIAMSGGGSYGFTDALEGVKLLGADAALRKPFRNEDLLSTVDAMVALRPGETTGPR
ncbi:MAG TPA: response regulator [Microvirga sp.]|nr:response regulator [Microvirga sp.]